MSGLEFGTKAMAKHSQTDKKTDVRSVSIYIEMRKDADRGRKDFLRRLFCGKSNALRDTNPDQRVKCERAQTLAV
jgi:hypothetical protein